MKKANDFYCFFIKNVSRAGIKIKKRGEPRFSLDLIIVAAIFWFLIIKFPVAVVGFKAHRVRIVKVVWVDVAHEQNISHLQKVCKSFFYYIYCPGIKINKKTNGPSPHGRDPLAPMTTLRKLSRTVLVLRCKICLNPWQFPFPFYVSKWTLAVLNNGVVGKPRLGKCLANCLV